MSITVELFGVAVICAAAVFIYTVVVPIIQFVR
jgi:hypothetical protein